MDLRYTGTADVNEMPARGLIGVDIDAVHPYAGLSMWHGLHDEMGQWVLRVVLFPCPTTISIYHYMATYGRMRSAIQGSTYSDIYDRYQEGQVRSVFDPATLIMTLAPTQPTSNATAFGISLICLLGK